MSVDKVQGNIPTSTQFTNKIPRNNAGTNSETLNSVNNTASPVKLEVNAIPTSAVQSEALISKVNMEQIKEDKMQNEEILERSVEQANKTLKLVNREILREVHETTRAVMYTIRDLQTHEIIAEFPPRKIQDMIAKMWELAGLFVDEKA